MSREVLVHGGGGAYIPREDGGGVGVDGDDGGESEWGWWVLWGVMSYTSASR